MMPSLQRVWFNLRAAILRDIHNLKHAVLLLLRAVKSMHTRSDARSTTPDSEWVETAIFHSCGIEPKGARRNKKRKARKLSRRLARCDVEQPHAALSNITRASTPTSVESPRFHAERSSRGSSPSSSSSRSPPSPHSEIADETDEKQSRASEFRTVQQHSGLEMGKQEVRVVMRSDQLPGRCIVLNLRLALESEIDCEHELKHWLN